MATCMQLKLSSLNSFALQCAHGSGCGLTILFGRLFCTMCRSVTCWDGEFVEPKQQIPVFGNNTWQHLAVSGRFVVFVNTSGSVHTTYDTDTAAQATSFDTNKTWRAAFRALTCNSGRGCGMVSRMQAGFRPRMAAKILPLHQFWGGFPT